MEATPKELRVYITEQNREPFSEWRSVGEGVQELRIDYGPGYRVYFGQEGAAIVLLLCGGDKNTQAKDIETAKRYWNEYRRRT